MFYTLAELDAQMIAGNKLFTLTELDEQTNLLCRNENFINDVMYHYRINKLVVRFDKIFASLNDVYSFGRNDELAF